MPDVGHLQELLVDGAPALGRWQNVFFCEFDRRDPGARTMASWKAPKGFELKPSARRAATSASSNSATAPTRHWVSDLSRIDCSLSVAYCWEFLGTARYQEKASASWV